MPSLARIALAAILLVAGCHVGVPSWVLDHPRTTSFDPTGTWYITIGSGKDQSTAVASVEPLDGPWFSVVRSDRPLANDFALVDGERLYAGYMEMGIPSELVVVKRRDYSHAEAMFGRPGVLGYEKWHPVYAGTAVDGNDTNGKWYEAMLDIAPFNKDNKDSPLSLGMTAGSYATCGIGFSLGYGADGERIVAERGRCARIHSTSSTSYTGLGSSEERKRVVTTTTVGTLALDEGVGGYEHGGDRLTGKRGRATWDGNGAWRWWAYEETWSRTPPAAAADAAPPAGWQRLPGRALDIAVGQDGSAWRVSLEAAKGGFAIDRLAGGNWTRVDGGAIRIAVAPDGSPWIVNGRHEVEHRVGDRWVKIESIGLWAVRDVGVGGDGVPWVVYGDPVPGGAHIGRIVGGKVEPVEGGAVRISAGPDGQPWVVNDGNQIFRRQNDAWQHVPGFASDIGVGGGAVWMVGADHKAYRWQNSPNWAEGVVRANAVSVGPDGAAWLVEADGGILRHEPAPAATPTSTPVPAK